jgi:GNT-I family protein
MNYEKLAPIVLFVYNRPKETIDTLNRLKKNVLSIHSDIYIYSDAAKNKNQIKNVGDVRRIIRDLEGFKSKTIIEAKINKGLATSVIHGVSEVINKYNKVIVMEDDLLCSENFLEFMNDALKIYENDERIWSISGYNSPAKLPVDYKDDIYLALSGSSWGWATWKNRWGKVDWNVSDFKKIKKNKKIKKAFELSGNAMYKILELQMKGEINSWWIRWVYSQFKYKKYTIYPCQSRIRNEGIKPGGTHGNCSDSRWMVETSNEKIKFPKDLVPNQEILNIFKEYQDLDWIGRIGYASRKYGFYKWIKKYKKYFRK